MSDAVKQITFPAQVAKVQTLADGGLRITLDTPETAILAAAQLMECKRQGIPGNVSFEPNVKNCKDEAEKGAKRGSPTVDSRRIEIRRD